ncbi:aminotransferase class V-fold PLP-dependent enzyme [Dactylosporangium sp. NPDC050688]|uniref:aminotransferase class V-fold PLP-dependent enzyme n=1 Tax=Dactylosporangium sp. NPDC050688 TaxID=3157217 RepID=UPI0033FC6E90
MIYLDHAATSFPKPAAVMEAMARYLTDAGNPGRSGHRLARAGEETIWNARRAIADLVDGTDPDRVVFAANATAALNTAIKGLVQPGDRILSTAYEHNSVVRPAHALAGSDVTWTPVPPTSDEPVDLDRLEAELRRGGVRVVAVAHASNVTGAVVPLRAVHALTTRYGATLVVDAAQTAGHRPVSVRDADVLVFAGHKGLLGPQGTGGMYVGDHVAIRPLIHGGTGGRSELRDQPRWLPWALESGTPNGVGVAGLAAGVRHVAEHTPEAIADRERTLRAALLDGLRHIEHVTVHEQPSSEAPVGVISVTIDGLPAVDAAALLEERHDIMVRGGLHCAPVAHETLGTAAHGTVRLSLSHLNSDTDVKSALEGVAATAESVHTLRPSPLSTPSERA